MNDLIFRWMAEQAAQRSDQMRAYADDLTFAVLFLKRWGGRLHSMRQELQSSGLLHEAFAPVAIITFE
eukprot:10845277-Heterocapsa_arctica.AAC.1